MYLDLVRHAILDVNAPEACQDAEDTKGERCQSSGPNSVAISGESHRTTVTGCETIHTVSQRRMIADRLQAQQPRRFV